MPNGRGGDHPYSDIVSHGMKKFGEPLDGLVRELARTGGCPEELANQLFEAEEALRQLLRVEHAIRKVLDERRRAGGTR
jgi:hypothetical protein